MDTAILVAVLIVALYILYRLPGRGSARGLRTYRTEAAARPVKHMPDNLEEDALHIWRLRKAGQQASRRQVTRRGEMTAREWNAASALLNHLALDGTRTDYATGAARIRAYIAEQQRLARGGQYVPPHGT